MRQLIPPLYQTQESRTKAFGMPQEPAYERAYSMFRFKRSERVGIAKEGESPT